MYRLDEEWQAYECADCSEDAGYEKPCVVLVPMGEQSPDWCPRCGSYLSFTQGADKLRITNTPAERWAAQREEAARDGQA